MGTSWFLSRAVAVFGTHVSGHTPVDQMFKMPCLRCAEILACLSHLDRVSFILVERSLLHVTLGALYLLFQDPTMWGRIKEKRFLYSPPPPPAFPSFFNNSQHMFPEYDLHMYLLILPKEVCDFFSTLIYSLTLVCYNSPAPVAFSNSVCIFILFSKLPFCPQYLELTLSHVGSASYCTAVKSILYCCDLPIHLHNKGLLPQSTINFCTRLKTLRSCVG